MYRKVYKTDTEKSCSICGEIQPLKNFHTFKNTKGNIKHFSYCRVCNLEIKPQYRKHRYITYGLTDAAVDELFKEGCKICSSRERMCVDHDHDTGVIRGCLCHRCNAGLGLYKENLQKLFGATNYLYSHQNSQLVKFNQSLQNLGIMTHQ